MFCKNCGQNIKNGSKFCQNCGQEVKVGRFTLLRAKIFEWTKDHRKGLIIFAGIMLFFVIIGIYDNFSTNQTPSNHPAVQTISYNQNSIAASVVNIFCPSTQSDEESSAGSGTIISENGLILTNSHIIPQDKINLHVDEEGCLVVLPDPTTGQLDGIYLAHPIVLPNISDDYDLAYMNIYAAYYDTDTKEYTGMYPRKFPFIDSTTQCTPKLGEPIRVFGYPTISGGYSLTITDGVVSSFPGDGLIVTSAKISHGNSGGLAVDKNGCMVGVPSMVSSDEAESFGVIYSMDLVRQFDDEVTNYVNNLK
jgi:hypothetical protein